MASSSFNWECPYCSRHVTIVPQSRHHSETLMHLDNADGPVYISTLSVVCPNDECKKMALMIYIHKAHHALQSGYWSKEGLIHEWRLLPPSRALVFPDYIPRPILSDYQEACAICELSPRASATLSRRCLQGILRDYWSVKPGRLIDEIEQVANRVDPITWQAIDAVRTIGNIGAHMEKDINTIVDVDPHEATLLIGLIETLLKDWYITRENKKTHLERIIGMVKKKKGDGNA